MKILFCKSWAGFVLFTTKESCLLTLSQCFLILCEWFLYPWFTQESHLSMTVVLSIPLESRLISHPSLVYCLILHFERARIFSKMFLNKSKPRIICGCPIHYWESWICLLHGLVYLCAALSVLQTEHTQGFHHFHFQTFYYVRCPPLDLPVSWEASTTTNIAVIMETIRSHAVQEVTM